MNKTEIKKFQNELNQYIEYLEKKRILRFNIRTRKYVIVHYHPRWYYAQKFRQNYKRKYGVEYRSKKQKRQAWAKIRAKMKQTNKP
jgi:hypothetical protein